ncbi:hypothetical protein ACI2OX_18950 [Bacillus sp. N9]
MLLMALNHLLNTEAASNLFMTSFVAVLSFVGGSFVPVGGMSDVMEHVGRYTPNGAAMAAYFDIFQGAGVIGVLDHVLLLLLIAAILSTVAWFVFPRKAGAR